MPVPAGEPVQATEGGHRVRTGPQHQVVGVGQHHLGAQRLEVGASRALTAPRVPTGMKAGVAVGAPWRDHPPVPGRPVGGLHLDDERVHRRAPGRVPGRRPLGPARPTTMASPKERKR